MSEDTDTSSTNTVPLFKPTYLPPPPSVDSVNDNTNKLFVSSYQTTSPISRLSNSEINSQPSSSSTTTSSSSHLAVKRESVDVDPLAALSDTNPENGDYHIHLIVPLLLLISSLSKYTICYSAIKRY